MYILLAILDKPLYGLSGIVIPDSLLSRVIDANGTVVVEYTYDAWGKVLSTTGSMASSLGSIQPFRYRRYVYDVETSLYYLNNRFYSTKILRFINEDVIVQKNGFNYCNNNPIKLFDPDGKQALHNNRVNLADGGGRLRSPSDEEVYFRMIQEHYPDVELRKDYEYATGSASITKNEADSHNTLMSYGVNLTIGATSFVLFGSSITTLEKTLLSGTLAFFLEDKIANGFHITAGDYEYHTFTYHVRTPTYYEKTVYSIRIYSYSKETVMEFRMQYLSSGPYWFPDYQYDAIVIGGENGL